MIHSDISGINHQIETLNDLKECILLDVAWRNQGTTIELRFNYIWDEQKEVRASLDSEDVVVLRFHSVQEFHVKNDLNDFMLKEPDYLNWGLSEIAKVVVEKDSTILAHYKTPVVSMHHIAVRWEGERRIDIIFSGLEVES